MSKDHYKINFNECMVCGVSAPSDPAKAAGDLDFRDRARLFQAIEEQSFDLIVIGGGITGAGLARSAAGRGLRVALVEAQDVAQHRIFFDGRFRRAGIMLLDQLLEAFAQGRFAVAPAEQGSEPPA